MLGPGGMRPRSRADMARDAHCDSRDRSRDRKPGARALWRRVPPARLACLALGAMACLGALTLLPARNSLEPSPVLSDVRAASTTEALTVPTVRALPTLGAPPEREEGSAPHRIFLSSHGRFQWLDVDTGDTQVVHESRGVYYGVFPAGAPGDPASAGRMWVISRPHNWRVPDGAKEAALLLDTKTGELLDEVTLPTQFTHDAIRAGDKAYVADTGRGAVLELQLPKLELLRTMQLFTAKEHINTLAFWPPDAPGAQTHGTPSLWAVLHNLGDSQLAQIDLDTGTVVRRLKRVGNKSHGLCLWQGRAVMLSSGQGRLIMVDLQAAIQEGDSYTPEVLWEDPQQTFMKGLTVINDIAYFGISRWGSRADRDDVNKTSEVGAFDLKARVLLWRRMVHTKGLLNVVSAPHISATSTSVAVKSWDPAAAGSPPARRTIISGDEQTEVLLDKMPYVPYDPSSGVPTRTIRLQDKAEASKLTPSRLPARLTGHGAYVALRHVDVSALAAALEKRPEIWDPEVAAAKNAILGGRESNMARFKPGCGTVHFVFSDQTASTCFTFPWWDEWKPLVQPILDEVFSWYGIPEAEWESRAVRLQLARMAPGGSILRHTDKGGWAQGLHRVHIPVVTNAGTQFLMQADASGAFVPLHVAPGDVFEINNAIPHMVQNSKTEERIHLLLDFSEAPIKCQQLTPGQHCEYSPQKGIVC